MAKKRKPRTFASLTAKERSKLPNLRREYGRVLGDINPGHWVFRVRVIRPGARALLLDPSTQSLTWTDEDASLTGALTLKRNSKALGAIGVGHRVRCEVKVGSGWTTLWEMAVKEPSWDVGPAVGEFELADDLAPLKGAKRDWSFRKTKARGKGWFAHEIAREVAKREGIKIRKLARGTKRLRIVKKKATGLSVILEAYRQEREHSKQQFIVRLVNGQLEVVALSRNSVVYEFEDQVTDAQTSTKRSSAPVTVIEGSGTIGKGGSAKKVKYSEGSALASRRFGRTVRKESYGRVDSLGELKFKVKRDLAKALRVTRTASIEVPGVPFLRRGDPVRWITDEPGWSGSTTQSRDRSFAYAARVQHTIAAGGEYRTRLELVQDDPYVKLAAQRDKEMREAARKRRKKKKAAA